MEDKEFLEKYGKEKVYFVNTYKRGVTYQNVDLGIKVYGILDYRDDMNYEEDVYNISQLEDFSFDFFVVNK